MCFSLWHRLTMGPAAIVKSAFEAVDHGNKWRWRGGCGVRTVISGSLGSELAVALLIGLGKVGLKKWQRFGAVIAVPPFLTRIPNTFGRSVNGNNGLVDGSMVGDVVVVGSGIFLGGEDSLEY